MPDRFCHKISDITVTLSSVMHDCGAVAGYGRNNGTITVLRVARCTGNLFSRNAKGCEETTNSIGKVNVE
ncbi:MAG: hypothetical protein CMQ05_13550 [Gammaproteobacteria bacterium]|mgnify:FL=1|nr:hypothetical protein [Gammaproteobacteria bacterium]